MTFLGYKHTDETKRRIKENHKGSLGKRWKLSEESRANVSRARLGNKNCVGRKVSEETRQKISKTRNERLKAGLITVWNKGKKHSAKTRKRIGVKAKERLSIPENNPNWQGGISFEPYGRDWTEDLKGSIRKRDNYICQMCGIHQEKLKRKLDVHHIDYIKDNLDPKNLISLCRVCHVQTNYARERWIDYFQIKSQSTGF